MVKFRPVLVILAGLALLLGTLGQVTGSYDDDDPDNDPNFCSSAEAPENCNWTCGWYQAAVNSGHVSLEAARAVCPDLQRTGWLPEELRREREEELERKTALYEDDDPTNDPNPCFESADPNCDWNRGWYSALIETVTTYTRIREADPDAWPGAPPGWLEARKRYLEDPDDPDDPQGTRSSTDIGWFCPPDWDPDPEERCPRPANQCGPQDNPTLGTCYYHN
ncbi:MAG: hypothetical protein OXB89_05675 [Anaerolineaceae bacterium]|nr:hypothetical protein [Anaerolineaceae bacterium]